MSYQSLSPWSGVVNVKFRKLLIQPTWSTCFPSQSQQQTTKEARSAWISCGVGPLFCPSTLAPCGMAGIDARNGMPLATRWCLLRWIVDSSNRPFLKSKYQDNFARMLRYANMEVYSLSVMRMHIIAYQYVVCRPTSSESWRLVRDPATQHEQIVKISVFPYVSLAFGRYAAFIIELWYTSTVNF